MARFCAQCGNQLRERSKFCPTCGSINREAEQFGRTTRINDRGGAALEMPVPAEATRDLVGKPTVDERVRQRQFAPPTHALVGAYEQAGFGLRFGALLFDLLIMMMAWMAATFLLSYLSNKSVVSSNSTLATVYLVALGLFVLNFVLLAGLGGKTIGKHIIGIRIVREDGQPFGVASAAYRHLVGYPLSALGMFLGFLWILWDPKQQGWHDKLVRTVVVIR